MIKPFELGDTIRTDDGRLGKIVRVRANAAVTIDHGGGELGEYETRQLAHVFKPHTPHDWTDDEIKALWEKTKPRKMGSTKVISFSRALLGGKLRE